MTIRASLPLPLNGRLIFETILRRKMKGGLNVKEIFHRNPIKVALAFLSILAFMGFRFWNESIPQSIGDRNRKEISRIRLENPDDFAFAVFGDNKGNYSFFEPLLREIDHDKEIAFAIDIGDLVSDGGKRQYRRFLNEVQENATLPLLTATGNHDFHNGFDNYEKIFGPTHYAFQIGQCFFIVLGATNESGFDKAERQWLENELKKSESGKARFVFMHIPPLDPRGGFHLPEKDRNDLADLFRRYKVTHLFASHIHGYFSGLWEGTPYTITGGAGARLQGSDPEHFFHHYVKVHVGNGKLDLAVRRIRSDNVLVRLYDFIEDHTVEGGLLFLASSSVVAAFLPGRTKKKSSKNRLGT